jgi:nucleoside-diphosphate-sugar epimerase
MSRKETVDRGAAVLCADAAERAEVCRYLMISAMSADREAPPDADPVFAAYLRAKGAADAYLRSRAGLDWTILLPGRLTNEPGTGLVQLAVHTGRGAVPRDDVAAVLLALLDIPVVGVTLELVTGDMPVYQAVRGVRNAGTTTRHPSRSMSTGSVPQSSRPLPTARYL